MTGTVTTLVEDRCFGFAKGEDDRSYFFHKSSIVKGAFSDLHVGDQIVFEPKEAPRGRRAEQVVCAV